MEPPKLRFNDVTQRLEMLVEGSWVTVVEKPISDQISVVLDEEGKEIAFHVTETLSRHQMLRFYPEYFSHRGEPTT